MEWQDINAEISSSVVQETRLFTIWNFSLKLFQTKKTKIKTKDYRICYLTIAYSLKNIAFIDIIFFKSSIFSDVKIWLPHANLICSMRSQDTGYPGERIINSD